MSDIDLALPREPPREPAASTFLAWNDALAARFFRPDMVGRRVFLYVNEEVVAELAEALGSSRQEFLDSVKYGGPPWVTAEGICQRALQALNGWRHRELKYPPYLGYLGVFVLAAGFEGDFKPWAYHPRLRALLGLGGTHALPGFDQMLHLWDDLELWSTRDRRGELGIFEVSFAGEWIHVGLPKAQALLTERERRALPLIFAEAGFDPGAAPPPASQLARALRHFGEGRLSQRTMRRVTHPQEDRELSNVLMEVVAEELEEWDGSIEDGDPAGPAPVRGVARLTLSLDSFAGSASLGVRCHAGRPFPDDGLVLSLDGREAFAEEEVPGWSTLMTVPDGRTLDGSELDWIGGAKFVDRRVDWTITLTGARARVFVSGDRFGLANMVETGQLPDRGSFYIAYQTSVKQSLSQWMDTACRGTRPVKVVAGFPTGWELAHVEGASEGLDDPNFPVLGRTDRVRARLVGGLRAAPGRNEYFAFAPPAVAVQGSGAVPTLNGVPLRSGADGEFLLPRGLPAEERIEIAVGDRRLALYLAREFAWRVTSALAMFDLWGDVSPTETGLVSGALIEKSVVVGATRRYPLLAVSGSVERWHRIYLVGRRPDEIAVWPREGIPSEWEPIWVVPMMSKTGEAVFSGGSVTEAGPIPEVRHACQRIDDWKDLLWHRRKRILPPRQHAYADLWRRYQEVARDV